MIQKKIPHLDIDDYVFNSKIVKLISKRTARKYKTIALDKMGDILIIARTKDRDITTLKESIKKKIGLTTMEYLGEEDKIKKAINKYYIKGIK